MRRISAVVVMLALGVLATRAAAPPVNPPSGSVRAVMELKQQFYYAGESLTVRITISNTGTADAPNPVKNPLFGSFQVADA